MRKEGVRRQVKALFNKQKRTGMRNRTFLLCTEDGIHELTMVMKRAFDEDAGIYSGKKKEVP